MSEYSGYKIQRARSLAALASVYEATAADGRPGRFALKVFHPPASTNLRRLYAVEGWLLAAERQQRSAKSGGAVVEVLACGRCEEGAYAVTPWQERPLEPLVETLAAKGDLLRALTECLLNTLEQWETQTGGPHGKLKASNVFLTKAGPLAGMTAQFSDPWYVPGLKTEALRVRDLAAIGAILVQIVRRRQAAGWPIEDAPEWKALGGPGKAWLAYCNYLLNPQPAEGELTIVEARKRLRKIPKDARPVRTAVLTGAAVVFLVVGGVTGCARFGDPSAMPYKLRKLAETVHNPRAFREEVTPDWARLCHAWDTWLVDLQSNAPRLLKTEGLWSGPTDPLKVALEQFVAQAASLQPGTLVPEAANEKRLGVLGDSPPDAVRKELLKGTVADAVSEAMNGKPAEGNTAGKIGVNILAVQLEKWPRWAELRNLLKLIQDRGFTRAAAALEPRLPPVVGVGGAKLDTVRTLKLFNDVSLDDTGTLLLASRWGEYSHFQTDMEASGDRVQKAMPSLILARLADRSSIGDFADSLADPLEEVRRRRKAFLDPVVVRERFLKESALQTETAAVTEADFPRWEQELVLFSKVPPAEDPRHVAEVDASISRLTASSVDLERDAPAAEPGGLPTLSQASFAEKFRTLRTNLTTLQNRPIVRRDLPGVVEETTQAGAAFHTLEQQLEATLALLKPEVWLAKVAQALGKFEATRQRWADWQKAALTGVTASALTADRPRFRALRAQERQIRDWIDGLEGSDGFGALPAPDLAAASADTAGALRQLEGARREQAATASAGAAEWRGALPANPWAAAGAAVRAPLEAHRQWLSEVPAFAADLDKLGELLTAGFTWTEGVSAVLDRLAPRPGLDALGGRPAEWHAEAKRLGPLVDSSDRAVLTAAAQSGGLSRKLTAWRRLGALADWPAGPEEFDLDGGVVVVMRETIGRDVKDDSRRSMLLDELVKETRLRWNRVARSSARNEKQLTAMFDRMTKYNIGEGDLEEPVAYNLALWRLKRSDWSETNLSPLRTRRDAFVEKVRAIPNIPAQPAVADFVQKIAAIELVDDPNRPPTPSPRMVGWHEEMGDGGLSLTAVWNSGGKNVKLDFAIVQPKDDTTPPFYLALREIAVGEFLDLLATRPKEAGAVLEVLPLWTRTETYDKPWNKPMAWRPRSDFKGLELNTNWIFLPDAQVKSLLDNTELRASTPALAQAAGENPTLRSPLQQVPPDAARIFAEKLLGARLPTPQEWQAVMKVVGTNLNGNFRGTSFKNLWSFIEAYREGGQIVRWRPNEGIFLPLVPTPGTGLRRIFVDDGQIKPEAAGGHLWFAPVDEGPAIQGFVNLIGNVSVYLYDEAAKQYYVAGGSALSPPGLDFTEPQKVEAKSMIGAKRVTEGFSDVGIRPAFDAPPGFRERYKLLLLVREQTYLTL